MHLKISNFKRIVVLTGAGISAESGIRTFRDSNGLWEQHRIEDVATPEAFERDPVLVWRFYSMRRLDALKVTPNAAHLALANFAQNAKKAGIHFTLVTQNVDMLHERAAMQVGGEPSAFPLAMHGTLGISRCVRCDRTVEDKAVWPYAQQAFHSTQQLTSPSDKTPEFGTNARGLPLSPCCQELLRPHIVWFGEVPLYLEEIGRAVHDCDLFVTVGSSGQVYPAAGFLAEAKLAGARTACLNMEELPQQGMVDFYLSGPATKTVPMFFENHL